MKTIWIELAARDIDRANQFYATVFGHEPLEISRDDTRSIIVIPGDPVVSVNQTAGFEPDRHGVLAYFDVDIPAGEAVEVAVGAGATLVEPISERPGYGYFALIADTEGNHLYLHSATR